MNKKDWKQSFFCKVIEYLKKTNINDKLDIVKKVEIYEQIKSKYTFFGETPIK